MNKNTCTLDKLDVGTAATVLQINCCAAMCRRLCDLGLIEGTTIRCLRRSPLGDPTAYMIRGAVIALRSEDAARIIVR